MTEPDTPGQAASEEHVVHHNSWAPIIIAVAAFFIAVGLMHPRTFLPIGLVAMMVGLVWWFREDVLRFRERMADPDAHGNHGVWAMWFFLGSEVVLFGGLFAVWFVGKYDMAEAWPPAGFHPPTTVALINTALLVSSGAVLHWGLVQLKKGNRRAHLWGHATAILLGLIFVAVQAYEYWELVVHEGFTLSGFRGEPTLYTSMFYVLTGTHGLHVVGGLVFLGIVLWRSMIGTQTAKQHVALEASAMYWHFVDIVWIFLVIVVYLGWL